MAEQDRVAKIIARHGLCSRRDAERWIMEGRVAIDGVVINSPAISLSNHDLITVDGKSLPPMEQTRLWIFNKPVRTLTTSFDPEGRTTIFDILPRSIPRVIAIGRLDMYTEGLLLLTNDGEFARMMEHPSSQINRVYILTILGRVSQKILDKLHRGITIDKIAYQGIGAEIESESGSKVILKLSLPEGKNREIRRICEHFSWKVITLRRISYGPFELGDLQPGEIREINSKQIQELKFQCG